MLSTEIGVEIVILGSDLQLEGITKNQSFGLDERDQPAVEILTKILKLANSDGKLVYVIKPRQAGGEPIIFVTTRAAAKKRGDPLPLGRGKINERHPAHGTLPGGKNRRSSGGPHGLAPIERRDVELFVIQCTTCRARLKVHDPAVVGPNRRMPQVSQLCRRDAAARLAIAEQFANIRRRAADGAVAIGLQRSDSARRWAKRNLRRTRRARRDASATAEEDGQ